MIELAASAAGSPAPLAMAARTDSSSSFNSVASEGCFRTFLRDESRETPVCCREWVKSARRPLFDGANGTIYKAADAQNTVFVVIKTVKQQPGQASDNYHRSVLREFDNLSRCGACKNAVNVLDLCCCEASEDLSLIIEYCPKGDLLDWLSTLRTRKIKMPTHVKDAIFKQIVRGVDFLHRHDIVHRDIKPENFLLDASGVVKINDFGCSLDLQKIDEQISLNPLNCGTPSFKAPELFAFEADPDAEIVFDPHFNFKAVDVWALGIVCFQVYLMSVPWQNADDSRNNRVMELYTKQFPSDEVQLQRLADRLDDKSFSTSQNPGLSLFRKIHYDARVELLHMLHPKPDKRHTSELLLQSSWLTQAYARPEEIVALMQ